MFEDPYLGDVLEKYVYDQIYDEHVFLFSVASIRHLVPDGTAWRWLMRLPQETHGGSMRYVIARQGSRPVSSRVEVLPPEREGTGTRQAGGLRAFRKNCEASRDALNGPPEGTTGGQGKRIVGYPPPPRARPSSTIAVSEPT